MGLQVGVILLSGISFSFMFFFFCWLVIVQKFLVLRILSDVGYTIYHAGLVFCLKAVTAMTVQRAFSPWRDPIPSHVSHTR